MRRDAILCPIEIAKQFILNLVSEMNYEHWENVFQQHLEVRNAVHISLKKVWTQDDTIPAQTNPNSKLRTRIIPIEIKLWRICPLGAYWRTFSELTSPFIENVASSPMTKFSKNSYRVDFAPVGAEQQQYFLGNEQFLVGQNCFYFG